LTNKLLNYKINIRKYRIKYGGYMKKSAIAFFGILIFASAGLGTIGLLTNLKNEKEEEKLV